MTRTVANLSDYTNEDGINLKINGRIYNNWVSFDYGDDIDSGHYPAWVEQERIADYPLSQDMVYWDEIDASVTTWSSGSGAETSGSGGLFVAMEGHDPEVLMWNGEFIRSDHQARPAIAADENGIFIYSNYQGAIYRTTLFWTGGSGAQFEVNDHSPIFEGLDRMYALHAFAVDDLAAFYINDGGVSVRRLYSFGGNWFSVDWGRRFMHPTYLYSNDLDYDIYSLNYTAAATDGTDYYFYMTEQFGSVRGLILKADGSWTDTFEVVPADLSVFKISNARYLPGMGMFYLFGQFQRVDPKEAFASSYVYNLALRSPNGKTFSLDRFTLFSWGLDPATGTPVCRYLVDFDGDKETPGSPITVHISDANQTGAHEGSWHFCKTGAAWTSLYNRCTKMSGDMSSQWSITLANGDELFTSGSGAEFLRRGNVLDLDVESLGSNGWNPFDLDTCIIEGISKDFADGNRSLSIQIIPESLWKTAMMTHPFYLEMQSKQSLYTDLDELDQLYDVTEDDSLTRGLCIDLWSDEPATPTEIDPGVNRDWWTGDLKERGFAEYPEITVLPMEFIAFGWSRSGGMSHYEGGGDVPGDSDAPNDTVDGLIKIERSGVESTIVVTGGSGGSVDTWVRDWYTSGSGAYPVVLEAGEDDGLQIGDTVIEVGLRLHHSGSDTTVSYPERIEIPDLIVSMNSPNYENWETGVVNSVAVPPPTECSFEILSFMYAVPNEPPPGAVQWYRDDSLIIDGDTIDFASCPSNTVLAKVLVHVSTQWVSDHPGHVRLYYERVDSNTGLTCAPGFYIRDTYPWYNGTGNEFYSPTVDFTSAPAGGWGCVQLGWEAAQTVYNDNDEYNNGLYFSLEIGLPDNYTWNVHVNATYKITKIMYDYAVPFHALPDVALYDVDGACLTTPAPVLPDDQVFTGRKLIQYGIPKILLATKPYSTFHFQTSVMGKVTGLGSWLGVVGLAKDGGNYIAARFGVTDAELIKVRNKQVTVLATAAYVPSSEGFWGFMEFRDGVFIVKGRALTESWDETPLIEYVWTEADGGLAVDDDLLHVGVYSFIDTPWAQIVGYEYGNGSRHIGVMPGASWELTGDHGFPTSGRLNIEGVRYDYTGKVEMSPYIRGPFQCRNTSLDNSYSEDGHSYSGNAVQFTMWENLDNGAEYGKYAGKIMASQIGYNWPIGSTDFHVYITTRGVKAYIRNRSAHYSSLCEGDHFGFSEKMWITGGFSGVSQVDRNDILQSEGAIAFLDRDNEVIISRYAASSGHMDATVEDMLEKIVHLAGGAVRFPGDTLVNSQVLTSGLWVVQNG